MRAGIALLFCLVSASCAGADPVGLFDGRRAEQEPIVETETLSVDLDALEGAAIDPEPSGPIPIEIPDDALDWTGRGAVGIDVQDNAFDQRVVVVSAGTELTWTNQGRNEHNVRPAIEGAFDPISATALAMKGDSASRVFAEPGDYPYFCSLHGTATNGQTGRIIVVPADSA